MKRQAGILAILALGCLFGPVETSTAASMVVKHGCHAHSYETPHGPGETEYCQLFVDSEREVCVGRTTDQHYDRHGKYVYSRECNAGVLLPQ